jgi:Leucine-rich repeat (LRR) protein
VGFSDECLSKVGFEGELERDALMELFQSTNGSAWKIRLNWGTASPLKDWFGVKVDLLDSAFPNPNPNPGTRRQERVVSIDLFDNNLRGPLPERLHYLTRLRFLRLGYNLLTGQVPLRLIQRIKSNRGMADLSNNPLLSLPRVGEGGGGVRGGGRGVGEVGEEEEEMQRSPVTVRDALLRVPSSRTLVLNFEDSFRARGPVTTLTLPRSASPLYNGDEDGDENEWEDIERAALMDLFNATNGPCWVNKKNWGNNLKPLSDWSGVSVNKSNQVLKIVLQSNNLSGAIPDSLYYMENLLVLDLRYNQLAGPIPPSLTNLSRLTQLYLHCNKLSCEIPEDIGKLAQLTILDLRNNQLIGTLPSTISNLRQLKYLGLKSNRLNITAKAVNEMIPWSRNVI